MTKFCFAFFFLIISATYSAQEPAKASGDGTVVITPEKMPEYPGGINALYGYIKQNLKYPQVAIDSSYTGKCFVKFVVNRDGSVSDVVVLKGVPRCPECDAEAVRVVKGIPERWSPGMLDGHAVRVYYTLPFNFSFK